MMIYSKLAFTLLRRPRRLAHAGFTLIEVLISVIISGLIVSGLLFLVVEALQLDRREIVLNQVQGDMRRAIDYISIDLKEAVYVYPPTSASPDIVGAEDLLLLSDDGLYGIPEDWELILALWRLDPLDGENSLPNCSSFSEGSALRRECDVLRVRQAYYTLVVYFQAPNDDNSIWEGSSRIIRYALPKYTAGGVSTLTQTAGYRDPTEDGVRFETWTTTANTPPRNQVSAVLVDNVAPIEPFIAGESNPNSFCDEQTGADPGLYIASPVGEGNSFIACVRNPGIGVGEMRSNQDIFLFLRGDASTGAGREFLNPFSEDSRFPPITARVMVRGTLDKPAPIR